MKKTFSLFILCGLCTSMAIVSSCHEGKINRTIQKRVLSMNSYPELLAAKDTLKYSRPYDLQLFDTLLTATYSNYNYQEIDYSEAFSVLDAVFKDGAWYVYQSVDSTMKTSVYNNLSHWSNLSKKISASTAEYQKLFGALESPNPNLLRTDSMISHYDNVLKLSKSMFRQKAERITPYSVSYQHTEDRIKQDKFWKIYFSNNSELKRNISEFPSRVDEARITYYDQLKDLIIKRAREDHPTSSQLSDAVRRFNNMTNSDNQTARRELSDYLASYEETDDQQPSNHLFWR